MASYPKHKRYHLLTLVHRQAKLSSLEDDLGMHGTQYNTVVAMATVGYIPMMIPSNMLITRVRPSLYLSTFATLWSIIATTMAACKTYPHMAGTRFLLGLFEAPFSPGALWLMSCWYTKQELGLRVAVMHSGSIMASSFAGLIAAGVYSKLEGHRGLGGWRWLFIIEGTASLGAALVSFFLLLDTPKTTTGAVRWVLNEEERRLAVERIEQDQVSNQKSNQSVWYGLQLALRDPRVWVLVSFSSPAVVELIYIEKKKKNTNKRQSLIACTQGSTTGYASFYPAMVEGMRIGGTVVTLLCTVPPNMLSAVVQLVVAWLSDRFRDRSAPIAASMVVMIIGLAVDMGTSRSAIRYFASFLYITGSDAVFSIPRAWVATAASQTSEERSCAAAIVEVMSALSYIWSPYFFRNEDAPRYRPGMIILIVFAVACILSAGLMRWILWRDNRKMLARYQGTGPMPVLHIM